jgi:cell division cycle 14
VHPLEFPDGSNPSFDTIKRFSRLVDQHLSRGKAVAVHCRAGLGRTGTLIGAYIVGKLCCGVFEDS